MMEMVDEGGGCDGFANMVYISARYAGWTGNVACRRRRPVAYLCPRVTYFTSVNQADSIADVMT
jgi:hypothetical protein